MTAGPCTIPEAKAFLEMLRGEWLPMVEALMKQSEGVHSDWQHGMGFGTLKEICAAYLGSEGACCTALAAFFEAVVALQAELKECDAKVAERKEALAKESAKIAKLDELYDLRQMDFWRHGRQEDELIAPLEALRESAV